MKRFQGFCTGVPDLIFSKACKRHDMAYTRAIGRKKADLMFLKDMLKIAKRHRYAVLFVPIAYLYFTAVRIFGWIFYPTSS